MPIALKIELVDHEIVCAESLALECATAISRAAYPSETEKLCANATLDFLSSEKPPVINMEMPQRLHLPHAFDECRSIMGKTQHPHCVVESEHQEMPIRQNVGAVSSTQERYLMHRMATHGHLRLVP